MSEQRCLSELDRLDDALEGFLELLDGEVPDSESGLSEAQAAIDGAFAAFRASFDGLGLSPDDLPSSLQERMEDVLAKYAVASTEAQRQREGLASELLSIRDARRRLSSAEHDARTGEECDIRG